MNTRKDYLRAVEIIQRIGGDRSLAIEVFVEFFETDNPRFDAAIFRDACR